MKFLLTSLLVFWGCCAWAQGSAPKELTYSRVILLDSASVVPAGKVWKVESYLPQFIFPVDAPNFFYINGYQVTFYTGGSVNGGNFGNPLNIFPFWIPAGTSLTPRWSYSNGVNSYIGQFSIIEFNEN